MSEQTFSQGLSAAQANEVVKARVQASIDEGARRRAQGIGQEIAEPEGFWNIWALGPVQVIGPGSPLAPHKVIKVGEVFYVSTVLWLSPAPTPFGSWCNLITNTAKDFLLEYCTNDMCRFQRATQFSRAGITVPLVPGQCFYVDTQRFVAAAGTESCIYEMNICARVEGCDPAVQKPQIAGFASAVYDFDPDSFYPPPGGAPAPTIPVPPGPPPGGATPFPGVPARWEFDIPIRFQIYP